MIKIQPKDSSIGILFPTSIKEITPEVLETISSEIKLPKYYCLVALAFETKLFDFVTTIKNPKNTTLGVTPILCKLSEGFKKEIKEESEEQEIYVIGNKVIVDRSTLERGTHINIKTMINSSSAHRFFHNHPELVKDILTNKDKEIAIDCETKASLATKDINNIVILEFKIIPVNDIVATVPYANNVDPFAIHNLNS